MNKVVVRICYGDEIYSEVKSEKNIAQGDVPKVAAYLANKLSIRASETATHEKRRVGVRQAKETRRAKEARYKAGGGQVQAG